MPRVRDSLSLPDHAAVGEGQTSSPDDSVEWNVPKARKDLAREDLRILRLVLSVPFFLSSSVLFDPSHL